MNKNIAILVLGLVSVGLAGGLLYFNLGPMMSQKKISSEKAGEMALAYINENILAGVAEATLGSAAVEENGLYKVGISIGGEEFFSYVTKDGKFLFPQGFDLTKEETATTTPSDNTGNENGEKLAGNFSETGEEVCLDDGLPIVYFFGANWCPHCNWEHPIVKEIAEKFAGQISFHDNMGTENDQDIFLKYNASGGIPTLVLGCKYFRVGSGENAGEESEKETLASLICDLTGGQPVEACQ